MNSTINVLALAYLGDAIYEYYIREYLLQKGTVKVKDLQEEAVSFVSAKSQCKYLKQMIEQNILTEEELEVVMRARNHKSHKSPKNTDVSTYKYATGLEALIGYLHIQKKGERIQTIMNWIIGE